MSNGDDEDFGPDQGQASFDAGNSGKMNPSNYTDPLLSAGSPQFTRDVNESPKRNEPPPSKGPTPSRKAAQERGAARHGHTGKAVAAKTPKHKK